MKSSLLESSNSTIEVMNVGVIPKIHTNAHDISHFNYDVIGTKDYVILKSLRDL